MSAWALAVGWSVLGWAGTGFAQRANTPVVSAQLESGTVDAGAVTRYQISIINGKADADPPAPVVPGLDFEPAGGGNFEKFSNGPTGFHLNDINVYLYSVRARHAGHYVIPAQRVVVNGTAKYTPAVTLNVEATGDPGDPGDSAAAQTLLAELRLPQRTAYLGESIPIEVRSYFGLALRVEVDPDPILTGEGFSVQKFTAADFQTETVKGITYNTASYKSAIAGLKIGPLTIGPAEIGLVAQLRSYRSYGLPPPRRQVKLRAEPVTLEIKPLPAGAPADFSGGIGQFKLDVEAEPRQAQAGDPVTVRLLLTGRGNFDRINAPVPADEAGLKTYPPKARFKADDDVGLSGVKTFEQVVIANGARTSLPSYRLSYLDPGTGKYVSLDTPPLAVRIAGSVATPAPTLAVVPPAAPAPSATPAPTPRAAADILYIRADPGVTRDRAAFLPLYQRRSFWLAQGVPLAMLLAALAGLGWRARTRNEAVRRRARWQREQGELQRALRRDDASRRDFYGAATRLAQLRAARGRTGSPLTAAEISQARGLDPQTARSVQEIFQRHDELAYSGGQVAREPVPAEERRGVLDTLETLGKNGK